MISVILYGRNDAHGYNLHRRAALSLNCIAEVLTDPNDEIVFVDYNTPDELPTFVEALADTLTERCLERLRVIRVPAAIHAQRFGALTHLPAIEPVARNAAVRRANPSNRWLLSTNTDMILLPRSGGSLSEVCAALPDGFYGLPRFELPEWLWERLPRSDPARAMAELERLGPRLRLDEPTVSNEWIRFDAPGDFQLVLREDFLAIDALDEQMLLGYHVDSNLSRRMLLHRGSIESLGESVAGYHCNHIREPTVYHGAGKVTNDLGRFVVSVDRPGLPEQRETWGLPDVELEEVALRERVGPGFAASVAAAIPDSAEPRTPSDAARVSYELTYDSGHVLPFVADSLAVSPPAAVVGYIGVNPVLERMLATTVEGLGFAAPLLVAELGDQRSVERLLTTADVLVVDLGVDTSLVEEPPAKISGYEPALFPARLDLVFEALERIVELERERIQAGEHPRRLVLVHSWMEFWDFYVLAQLDCSHTTAHSRVRRATVKAVPVLDDETRARLARERRCVRWAAHGLLGPGRVRLRPGEEIELADLSDYRGFGTGWSYPEEDGIWTQGTRSELALALEGVGSNDYLMLSVGNICARPGSPLRIEAHVNGNHAAAREFAEDDPSLTWSLELPPEVSAAGVADLTLAVENPGQPIELGWSTDDERPLGIRLRAVALLPGGAAETEAVLARERRLARWAARSPGRVRLRSRQELELAELEDYGGFDDGWAHPDEGGVWTQGTRSGLALALDGEGERHSLILSLGDVCVGSDAPLKVDVHVNGDCVGARELGEDDPNLTWSIELDTPVLVDGQVDLSFVIHDPRSPAEVGRSDDDDRPLGVLLSALTLLPGDSDEARSARAREHRLARWAARGDSGAGRLVVRPREQVELARLDDFGGFGTGWSYPDEDGIWTQGARSELALLLDAVDGSDFLTLSLANVCVGPGAPLRVEALVNAVRTAVREFTEDDPGLTWTLELPPPVRGDPTADLTLLVEEPRSPAELGWSAGDERPLGILLRAIMLGEPDRSLPPGERIVFTEGSGAERLLGDGWWRVEATGVWTVREQASLVLELTDAPPADAELVLGVNAFVTPDHPELGMEVSTGDERLTSGVFRHGRSRRSLRVPLPATVHEQAGRLELELHLSSPARPADLGLGSDMRRLGIQLEWLAVERYGARTKLRDAIRDAAATVRRA